MNRFNVDQGTSGLSASVEMEGPSRRSLASIASIASMASMVVVEIHEVSSNDHPVRTIIEVVAMKQKGNRKQTKRRPFENGRPIGSSAAQAVTWSRLFLGSSGNDRWLISEPIRSRGSRSVRSPGHATRRTAVGG